MKTTYLTQLTKFVATSVAVAMLSACGGGSSSSDTNSTILPEENSTITEVNASDVHEILPPSEESQEEQVIVQINHAPLITSAALITVEENQNRVMTITATDEDNDTIIYSIEGGEDASRVAINPLSGEVLFLNNPDFETQSSYHFSVGASDQQEVTTQEVTVMISDLFEGSAPVITNPDHLSVDENQKSLMRVVATDVDGDVITYSLAGGVDDDAFDINATTGVITFKVAPDYETKDRYQITVGASDGHDLTTKEIDITINDLVGGSTVLQTGQHIRYVVGDDGDYEVGIERSFNKEANIVHDEATGLYWKDNSYIALKSHDDAVSYCSDLVLSGYSDWRLPSISELESIVNRGTHDAAIFDTFEHTNSSKAYWSSTEYLGGTGIHYAMDFETGIELPTNNTHQLPVRCVREPMVRVFLSGYERFSRANNVVSDADTKLQWYDPASFVTHGTFPAVTFSYEGEEAAEGNFEEAIAGCEALVADGKNDWRLPDINELMSILDYDKEGAIGFNDIFKSNTSGNYLSSTTQDADSSEALSINFAFRIVNSIAKDSSNYYRCVRTMGD